MFRFAVLALLVSTAQATALTGDDLQKLCNTNFESAVDYSTDALKVLADTTTCAASVPPLEFAYRMCEALNTEEHPWMFEEAEVISIVLENEYSCRSQ